MVAPALLAGIPIGITYKVYALDVESLGLKSGATRREVESKMQGHIIGQGQTMGRYGRR